jgi:hypothetical protein
MNYDLLRWMSNIATAIVALFMVGILIVFTIAWMLGIPMPTGEGVSLVDRPPAAAAPPGPCAPRAVLYLPHPGAVPQRLLLPSCVHPY